MFIWFGVLHVLFTVGNVSNVSNYVNIEYEKKTIRQGSDYVTGVKDRRWASNRITLEFDLTVQDCTQ